MTAEPLPSRRLGRTEVAFTAVGLGYALLFAPAGPAIAVAARYAIPAPTSTPGGPR
jgi:hypothetical protein